MDEQASSCCVWCHRSRNPARAGRVSTPESPAALQRTGPSPPTAAPSKIRPRQQQKARRRWRSSLSTGQRKSTPSPEQASPWPSSSLISFIGSSTRFWGTRTCTSNEDRRAQDCRTGGTAKNHVLNTGPQVGQPHSRPTQGEPALPMQSPAPYAKPGCDDLAWWATQCSCQ